MRPIIIAICLICAFTVLFLSCGTRNDSVQSAILTGRVTDTDTTVYLAGVKVFESSHAQGSTVTDSAGFFRLEGVMFEEHNIYFEKEGYEKHTLWFEYSGTLKHPVVTRHVIMTKTGEGE
jgi:hypothetical protein